MVVKKWLHIVAFVFVSIGALNLGIFDIVPPDANGEGYDLLQRLLGFSSDLLDFTYIMIGVSGIYLLATHFKECASCAAHKESVKEEEKSTEA